MNLVVSEEHSTIRKWKSYPKYKESNVEWLEKIPAHWETIPLKHVAEFLNGLAFKPAEWGSEGIPIIRIENLNRGEEFNYVTLEVPPKYHVFKGDLLFGWSGNRGTSFGPFIWPRDGVHYLNQHIFKIQKFEWNKIWLYWVLKEVTHYVEKQAHGIIGMVHITSGDLGIIPVPQVCEQEQLSIAAFLDRETAKIDALVAKKERLIELLQEKRAALISRAVTKGLPSTGSGQATPNVPMKDSGVEWLGEIPAHWERKPAKAVCQRIIDCKNRTPEYDKDGDFPVVRTTDVREGKLSLAQCLRTDEKNFRAWTLRGAPERDDILFTREAPAGEAAFYDGTQPICLGQRMMYFRVNPEVLVSRFLLYSIYGALVKGYILAGSGGSTVTHLRLGQVYNLPLLIPPVTEQSAIVGYLDGHTTTIDRMVAKVKEGIERLQEYRTALITAVVTGKIDVRGETSL